MPRSPDENDCCAACGHNRGEHLTPEKGEMSFCLMQVSGYVQSWTQRQASVPSFNIGPKRGWDAATNTYATDLGRAADVYVFALHAHLDRTSLDPLDAAQWQFLVLRTTVLNERCAMQKRIGLRALRSLGPREASFEGLKVAIEAEVGLGAAGELRSLGA